MVILYSILALSSLACGIVGSGFAHAMEKRRWPDIYEGRVDLSYNLLLAIFGLATLIACYVCTDRGSYGWTLSTKPEQ